MSSTSQPNQIDYCSGDYLSQNPGSYLMCIGTCDYKGEVPRPDSLITKCAGTQIVPQNDIYIDKILAFTTEGISYIGNVLYFYYTNSFKGYYVDNTGFRNPNKMFTFPPENMGETVVRSFNEVWTDDNPANNLQKIVIGAGGLPPYNPYSKYFLDIYGTYTENGQQMTNITKYKFTKATPQGTVRNIFLPEAIPPVENNLPENKAEGLTKAGGYTFIGPNNTKLKVYIKNNKLYSYDTFTHTQKPLVLTFPRLQIGVNEYKYDCSTPNQACDDIFQIEWDPQQLNLYSTVSKTAEGYIFNPVTGLYLELTGDPAKPNKNMRETKFKFTKTKPEPMRYYKGAWNDAIVGAKKYGDDVVKEAAKYFSYVMGNGDTPADIGVQTYCGYSHSTSSGTDYDYIMCSTHGGSYACSNDGSRDRVGSWKSGGTSTTWTSCVWNDYSGADIEKCMNFEDSVMRISPVPIERSDSSGNKTFAPGTTLYLDTRKCPLSWNGMIIGDFQANSGSEKYAADKPNAETSDRQPLRIPTMGQVGDKVKKPRWGDNVAWYPFASGSGYSDTIINFCGSLDEYGKVRRNRDPSFDTSKEHGGCVAWKQSPEANLDANMKEGAVISDTEKRVFSPLSRSQRYTCMNFINDMVPKYNLDTDAINTNSNEDQFSDCYKPVCIEDEKCKAAVATFCKGKNLKTNTCRQFCRETGACNEELKNYCQQVYSEKKDITFDITGAETKEANGVYGKTCGCFYPNEGYDKYWNIVNRALTNSNQPTLNLNLSEKPLCYFHKCMNVESIHPVKQSNLQTETGGCPAIQICNQRISFNAGDINTDYINVANTCNLTTGTGTGIIGQGGGSTGPTGGTTPGTTTPGTTTPGTTTPGTTTPGTTTPTCSGSQILSSDGKSCVYSCLPGQEVDYTKNKCVPLGSASVPASNKNTIIIASVIGGVVLLIVIAIFIVKSTRKNPKTL